MSTLKKYKDVVRIHQYMNYDFDLIEKANATAISLTKQMLSSPPQLLLDNENYDETLFRLENDVRVLNKLSREITHKYDILPRVTELEDTKVRYGYLMPEIYSYFEGETYDQYQVGNYIVDKSNNIYTIVEKDDDGDIRAKNKSGKIHFFPMNRNGMRNGAPIHGRLYAAWPKLGCEDRSFLFPDENRFIVAEKANRIPEHLGIPLPKGVTTHFVIDKQRNYTYELNSIDVYELLSMYPQWTKMIPYFEQFKFLANERKHPSNDSINFKKILSNFFHKREVLALTIQRLPELRQKKGYTKGFTPHLTKLQKISDKGMEI